MNEISNKQEVEIDLSNLCENVLNDEELHQIKELYNEYTNEALTVQGILYSYHYHFDFIYNAFKKLLVKEGELQNALELNRAKYADLSVKFDQSLKLATIDKQTIVELKQQVENAWKLEKIANQKEKQTRETVNGMKLEVANLSKLVEQGVGLTMGQEYSIHEILRTNESLNETIGKLEDDIEFLNNEVNILNSEKNEKNVIHEEAKAEIMKIAQELSNKTIELNQEVRKNERLLNELSIAKNINETKESIVSTANQSLSSCQSEIFRQQQKIKEMQGLIEVLQRDLELQKNRYSRLQNQNDQLTIKNESLSGDIKYHADDMLSRDTLIANLREELLQAQKTHHMLEVKIKMHEEQFEECEKEKNQFLNRITNLKSSMESLKKEQNIDKNELKSMERVKSQLLKNIKTLNKQSEEQIERIRKYQNDEKHLTIENKRCKNEINELKNKIAKYEKEKLLQNKEINGLSHRLIKLVEELKLKEVEIVDLEKRIKASDAKIKQMQMLYENVRGDCNSNAKNLNEIHEEADKYKKELAIIKNQNDNLSSCKTQHENEIANLKSELDNQRKNTEKLQNQVDCLKKQKIVTQQLIDSLNKEKMDILKNLNESDDQIKKISKNIHKLTNERILLGSQLVRRNDEISLLYEKIRILEKTLTKGKLLYAEKLMDIKILRNEVIQLRKTKINTDSNQCKIIKLKDELCLAEKELLNEKMKRYALDEMMNIPQNIHRWRTLSGSDPDMYQLIVKTQELQKRLILKYNECNDAYLRLNEKDEIFKEIKIALARRLDSGDAQKTQIELEHTIKAKTRKLKSALAERNMLERINLEFQKAVQCKDNEIKYFKEKISKFSSSGIICYGYESG